METFQIVNDESCIIGKNNDLHEGMGPIAELVDIRGFIDEKPKPMSKSLIENLSDFTRENGICDMCGYDRAVYHTHTELAICSLECDNCGRTIAETA